MSAANDAAVARFLDGKIPFGGIWQIIGKMMEQHTVRPQSSIEEMIALDRETRIKALEMKL